MAEPTRWATEGGPERSRWYLDRFRRLAAEGADLAGEARLVDAVVAPGSWILDAGCGTGRVAAALAARGHAVLGVDADPFLVEAAAEQYPGPDWRVADLTEFELAPGEEPFDAIVIAGNVMTFMATGTEPVALRRMHDALRPDGLVLVGFGTERGYAVADFDEHLAAAGLTLEHRFATWDLRPWHDGADFAVTLARRTA